MNNSFQIALDQLENNIINVDGVRAINVCNAADDLLAALQGILACANVRIDDPRIAAFDAARAAIAKATK